MTARQGRQITLGVIVAVVVLGAIMWRQLREGQQSAMRTNTKGMLAQLYLGVRNYEAAHGEILAFESEPGPVMWRKMIAPMFDPIPSSGETPEWLAKRDTAQQHSLTSFVMVTLSASERQGEWLIVDKPPPGVKWTSSDNWHEGDLLQWARQSNMRPSGIPFVTSSGVFGTIWPDRIELDCNVPEHDCESLLHGVIDIR